MVTRAVSTTAEHLVTIFGPYGRRLNWHALFNCLQIF